MFFALSQVQGDGAKPQCLVKGYTLQHCGHPQTINKNAIDFVRLLSSSQSCSDTMSGQQLN